MLVVNKVDLVPYVNCDLERLIGHARGILQQMERARDELAKGAGTPVVMTPEDFEIERTEQLTRSATVLMLDVSMSMEMRGRFLAAKKVAMALHSLITSQYPRDYFGLVSFGRVAREVRPERLPEATWDFEWGTNMHHAMMLARRMLARETGRKQIIMITDGEPTAHVTDTGDAFFDYPPDPLTIELTLREVQRCTRDGIRINTFMLEDNPYLRDFVARMMRMNRGRAFYTTPETLGDYVLEDFLDAAFHEKGLLGDVVVLAFENFLEGADGVRDLDVLAVHAGDRPLRLRGLLVAGRSIGVLQHATTRFAIRSDLALVEHNR